MPSKKIICSRKRNHERSQYDLDQVMAMRPTDVATPAKDLNISLSALDRTEKLEQEASRGTLLPFLASEPHFSRRFLWYFSPPPGYKGVPLEGNRLMLPGEYCGPEPSGLIATWHWGGAQGLDPSGQTIRGQENDPAYRSAVE